MTDKLFDPHYETIREMAIAAYPNEGVWLVSEDEVIELENLSEDPRNSFKVDAIRLAAVRNSGIPFGLVHSHPDAYEVPSAYDMRQQLMGGEPWAILSTDGVNCSEFVKFGAGYEPDLWERHFVHGVADCYSFLRTWYAQYNVALPEFPRDWQWWQKDENLYIEGFSKAGFEQVHDTPRKGDMFMFALTGDSPSHAAVYEGDELISHHVGSRLPLDETRRPVTEPIHRWLPLVSGIFRHKDFPDVGIDSEEDTENL